MTRTVHIVLQCFLGFGQVVAGPAIAAFMLDDAWASLVHAILAGMTIVAGILASESNPDGTPAETAYKPKQ